jgi:hypothetical protein
VPVICPEEVLPVMAYLADPHTREKGGIKKENTYLFANSGKLILRNLCRMTNSFTISFRAQRSHSRTGENLGDRSVNNSFKQITYGCKSTSDRWSKKLMSSPEFTVKYYILVQEVLKAYPTIY